MSTRRFRPGVCALFALLLAAAASYSAPASAAASQWGNHEFARARLVSAVSAVGELGELRLGLQIRMNPGWKTYWRSPGDAGLPAQIDWSGSQNLADVRVLWPTPQRHTLLGIETLGYEDEVLLPLIAIPARAGEPVKLRASVDYLVCEKICVPAHADLALDLPAGPAVPSPLVDLVDRWRAKVPGTGAATGLSVDRLLLVQGPAGATLAATLAIELAARDAISAPDVFVEGPAGTRFGPPQSRIDANRLHALLLVPVTVERGASADLLKGELTLTVVDGARAIELKRAASPGTPADIAPSLDASALAWMLLTALLGGLILNLMPCVLPVLSLKLLSVVGHGGGEAREVRLGFLASAAGILASFLVLAGFVLALRASGMAVGWGIQFQQPVFIAAMAVILVLFAANLMGWFEIGGPRFAFAAAGTKTASHGMTGHFLTGALATLLATPCSAPFLGTAIGFALARGPVEIVAIFLVLGIGLALPYLAVAAFPKVATMLPRPGRWMLHVRRLLGVALAASAVWLVAVLAAQRGTLVAVVIGMILLAMLLCFALRNWLPASTRRAVPAAVAVFAFAAIVLAYALPASVQTAERDDGYWKPFDEAAIPDLVGQGRVVFVDVTADWCITCQANKTLVLRRGEVAQKLGGGEIVAMRADWTRPDPQIAQYLARFGRYGIPFNVVYGPAAPAGISLPELLTTDAVLTAMAKAGPPASAVAKRP